MTKRKLLPVAGALMALAIPATASAQPVQSLSTGDWSTTNSTVIKTPDGVHFGTYADGGAVGGSLLYKGANGTKLKDVKDFSFTFNYNQAGSLTGATPYGRIWLDTDKDGVRSAGDATIMLDPSLGGSKLQPMRGTDVTFGTRDDSVRYEDDKGNGGQQTWSAVKAAHSDEKVIAVGVSQGFSMGTDVSAMLKNITLNGKSFEFNVASADGKNGSSGTNGAAGTTTVIHVTDPRHTTGNTLRTLRISKTHQGAKLKSATAILRGKTLKVRHGKVTVDLRHKAIGNYNVRITAKYLRGGKVHTHRSARKLSVAIA
jgi:hypothetical protein